MTERFQCFILDHCHAGHHGWLCVPLASDGGSRYRDRLSTVRHSSLLVIYIGVNLWDALHARCVRYNDPKR